MYKFAEQREIGEASEAILDQHFQDWFYIHKVDMDDQLRGIDRIWVSYQTGVTYTVEYKTDNKAASTGNAFIETESVKGQTLGWAYTSQAQLLVYRVPGQHIIVVPMVEIKHALCHWLDVHRSVSVQNDGWTSAGLLVPLDELKHLPGAYVTEDSDAY